MSVAASAGSHCSRSRGPDSGLQDGQQSHQLADPAATLPEYSQQPIDGIDMRAQVMTAMPICRFYLGSTFG